MYAKFIGVTAETAVLIELRRQAPHESEDAILRRVLAPEVVDVNGDHKDGGCDLGQGAVLREDEELYLFRRKQSRDMREPEATAQAKGGRLYLYDQPIERSKGSLLQPALRIWQERLNDVNNNGDFISLDAWKYWYVKRHNRYVVVSSLRDQKQIVRRGQIVTLEDLDL